MTAADNGANYFVLLELDPQQPWDQALFIRTVEAARQRWTKASTGLSTRASEAKTNLHAIRNAERDMSNPEQREQQRAAALRLREAAVLAERRELTELLDVWLARGFLLEAERQRAEAEYGDVLAGSPKLAKRIRRAKVRSLQPPAASSRLDTEVEDQLRTLLAEVRARSLYDVLKECDPDLTSSSPRERLMDAAEALERKMRRFKDKSDPNIGRKQKLGSHARRVFATEDLRRRHDESMRVERLRDLVVRFEWALSLANEVRAAQVELFLLRARAEGVDDLEQATTYLVEHFRARGWPVQLPAEQAQRQIAKLLRCLYCQDLNQPTDGRCQTCGEDLEVRCPSCDRTERRYGGDCRCGFPIGQRRLVESLVLLGRTAIERLDFTEAQLHLDRAARIWQLPPGRADQLAEQITGQRLSLEQAQQAIAEATATVQLMITARRFVAAERQLRAAPAGLLHRDELLRQAERAVRAAQALCQRAGRPGLLSASRAELYAEALAVCDDYEPAHIGLRQILPEPPTRARGLVADPAVGVSLNWEPSPEPGVSYVVFRTTGPNPPTSVEAMPGQQIAETGTTSWLDRGATRLAGQPIWYAVFAKRRGTYSIAALTEPVLVAADVVDLRSQVQDGRVILTWALPEHAAQVEVRRTDFGSAADTRLVACVEPGRVDDQLVHNGVRYRYTIRVGYRDLAGRICWSPGVSCTATPMGRPAPPGPLTITGEASTTGMFNHRTLLRWPTPEMGTVKVVRQLGVGSLREGDQGTIQALGRDGVVLEDDYPASDIWLSDLVVCSYFPVLVVDGSGHVGQARRYAKVDEPTQLRVEFAGAEVRIGWAWPQQVSAVLIGHDPAGAPVDPTAAADPSTVNRVDVEPFGSAELPVSADDIHLVIASVVRRDGVDFVTSGVRLRAHRPTSRVYYEVRQGRRGGNLLLHTDGRLTAPELVLVGNPDRTPKVPADGERIALSTPPTLGGQQDIRLPRSPGNRALHYRLFTAASAETAAVELVGPPLRS